MRHFPRSRHGLYSNLEFRPEPKKSPLDGETLRTNNDEMCTMDLCSHVAYQ